MGSIPLPALDIRPAANPLDEYAKALSVKSMISSQQTQQLQQQHLGLENQNEQQAIADRNAMTTSMTQWDGKNFDDLPALILKNGGSANAVFAARKQLLDQRQALSKIAADDATTGEKNLQTYKGKMDQIAGTLGSLADVPDANLKTEALRGVNTLLTGGMIDADHGKQLNDFINSTSDIPTLRTGIDHYIKAHQGASELAANAEKNAQTGKAVAEANLANMKVKMYQNTKPGDFDATIDKLAPPTGATADVNQQTKTLVNSLLARGDYEGASKALENSEHILSQRAETNYVQNREDYRQAQNRQANQSNQLQKNGLEQLDKIWTDPQHGYTQFLAQANATKTAVADAKNGNELAASLAPLMTVLGVNSFAGVHRINPQEYAAAGPGVGSIYRRVNTLLDKASAGKLNPDTANEMNSLIDGLMSAKHASLVPASQLIAKNAGLDPKQTTIFNKDGQPGTLDDVVNGRVQTAPQGNTAPAKVLTQAQIQQAAKDHGVSVEEATRQAKAAGYTIK
jgi:hypothetical protein